VNTISDRRADILATRRYSPSRSADSKSKNTEISGWIFDVVVFVVGVRGLENVGDGRQLCVGGDEIAERQRLRKTDDLPVLFNFEGVAKAGSACPWYVDDLSSTF